MRPGDEDLKARPTRRSRTELVPLLGAKLLPPTPAPSHLPRARLQERLASGLEGRATVILAGPGYGKTSLAARFIQNLGGDSVWYSLDPADRDPWMFFRYIVHGIREHAPEFGERIEAIWKDPRPPADDVERFVDILVSDAEETLEGRLVLVFDEVHHLDQSPLCTRALKRLLAYLPGTLHLFLVGRSLPELGTRALVAEGAINVVSGEELLFTLEETRILLLENFGLRMQPETVEKVHSRTRGWVTALQLLRQTARIGAGAPELPDEVFARTESEIFDYFTEEVIASEPEDAREFLLGSSVPAFIDPDICAEVLVGSDVRGILARLIKRRLFISPLESQSEYYAYDPLFRDFLRRKLRTERGAPGKRDLDLGYGRAFARRGAFTEALAHWIAAEEVEGVTDLLRRHGHALLRAGTLDLVLQAAHFVAGRGVRSGIVEDLLGEASRLGGDYAAAVGHFERALAAMRQEGPELQGTSRANTMQGLAYSLLKKGEPARAAAIAEAALEEAGEEDLSLLARILNTLAIIRYRENRLQEALDGWQRGLALARQAEDHHLVLMIAHNLGLPHAVLGDFHRASEYFQVLTSPDNPRVGPQEGAAYLNLARLATIRGDFARSASLLSDAREIARKWRLQSLEADVLEEEGNLLRESGEMEAAAEKYTRARALFTELGQHDVVLNIEEETAILAARRGSFEEAERLGASVVERWRSSGEGEGMASALLALGEIRVRAGDPGRARDPLVEAAGLFASLGRAYQECMARLWLALALFRIGERAGADEAGEQALRLALKFDYQAPLLRVAGLDAGLTTLLGSLPSAPTYLKKPPSREEEEAAQQAGASVAVGADLTVRLLGPIEVFRDADAKIPASAWKITRSLQMFCHLACSRGHRASKDRIVDALWRDARPSAIEKNFHPTMSFLRRALNHGHKVSKNFILYERGAYLLSPDYRYEIDTEVFEDKIRSAKVKAGRGEAADALADYRVAIDLYRGPFMEEDYSEWTEAPRSHLESLYVAALREAADLHIKEGEPESALSLLEKLVQQDPLDENVSVRCMRALASLGHHAAIEKEYKRLVHALGQELDARPLPETRRAYEKCLEASAAPRPAPESARTDGVKGGRPGRRAQGGGSGR